MTIVSSKLSVDYGLLTTLCFLGQVAYRSGKEQFLHQYTITKDDPVFLLAKANAANISEVLCETVDWIL